MMKTMLKLMDELNKTIASLTNNVTNLTQNAREQAKANKIPISPL